MTELSESTKLHIMEMRRNYCKAAGQLVEFKFFKVMHQTKWFTNHETNSLYEKKGRINIWRNFERIGNYFLIERKHNFILIFSSHDKFVPSFIKRTKTFEESCLFCWKHYNTINHKYLQSFERYLADQDEFYHMELNLIEKSKQINNLFNKIQGNPVPKKITYDNIAQLKSEVNGVLKHATHLRRTLQYYKKNLEEDQLLKWLQIDQFTDGEDHLF